MIIWKFPGTKLSSPALIWKQVALAPLLLAWLLRTYKILQAP